MKLNWVIIYLIMALVTVAGASAENFTINGNTDLASGGAEGHHHGWCFSWNGTDGTHWINNITIDSDVVCESAKANCDVRIYNVTECTTSIGLTLQKSIVSYTDVTGYEIPIEADGFRLKTGQFYSVVYGDTTNDPWQTYATAAFTWPIINESIHVWGGNQENGGFQTTAMRNIIKIGFSGTDPIDATTLNQSGLSYPLNVTQFSTSSINLNVSINSSTTFNASLFLNGTLNQTLTNLAAGSNVFVNFTVNFNTAETNVFTYSISASNVIDSLNTTTKTFYIDNVDPAIEYDLDLNKNISVFYKTLDIQFNFTDSFMLYSYNISLNGQQISGEENIADTARQVNLSYNVENISGQQTLTIRTADGHTAKELGGEYDYKNGLFNNYIEYEFWDAGYVRTELKDSSIFDSWDSEKKIDRYSQILNPANPSSTITLVEESDKPIKIVRKPGHYNDVWLIIGDHWKDYVLENEPDAKVTINRINDYKVEVTISNIKNTEELKFNSIGDLNVITKVFDVFVTAATLTYVANVPELQLQTISLAINLTTNITSTAAFLTWNGTNTSYTKSSTATQDIYTSSFVTPDAPFVPYNISFTWDFLINTDAGFINSSIVQNQTIFALSIDNCSVFSTQAATLTIINETGDNDINASVNAYFELWTTTINNFTEINLTFRNGNDYGICIEPAYETYNIYGQLEYFTGEFATKTYYFTNTSFNNVTKQFNLYLTEGTTQVTFTARDENDIDIEGAIIKVLSYDIGTDTSKVTEILKTDSAGQAQAQLILNTAFYQFIIELNGVVIETTEPTKITSATNNFFRISLTTDYLATYTTARDVTTSLTFNNDTLAYTFVFSDTTSTVREGCLDIIRRTVYGDVVVNTSCVTSSASSITLGIGEPSDNTFIGKGYIKINPTFLEEILPVSFNLGYAQYDSDGVFISFLLTLTLTLIGIWSPIVAVFMLMVSTIIIVISGLFYYSWAVLISFLIIGGIAMFRLSRD